MSRTNERPSKSRRQQPTEAKREESVVHFRRRPGQRGYVVPEKFTLFYNKLRQMLTLTGNALVDFQLPIVGDSPMESLFGVPIDRRLILSEKIRSAYRRGQRISSYITRAADDAKIDRDLFDHVLHHNTALNAQVYLSAIGRKRSGGQVIFMTGDKYHKITTMHSVSTALAAVPAYRIPDRFYVAGEPEWFTEHNKVRSQLERLDLAVKPHMFIQGEYREGRLGKIVLERVDDLGDEPRLNFSNGAVKIVVTGTLVRDIFTPSLVVTFMELTTRILSNPNRTGKAVVAEGRENLLYDLADYSGRSPYTHLPNSDGEIVQEGNLPVFSRSEHGWKYDPSVLAPRYFNPKFDYTAAELAMENEFSRWSIPWILLMDEYMRERLYHSAALVRLSNEHGIDVRTAVDTLLALIEGTVTRGDDLEYVLDLGILAGRLPEEIDTNFSFRIPSWTLASVLASTTNMDVTHVVDGRRLGIRGREKSARQSLVPPCVIPVSGSDGVIPVYTFTGANWRLFATQTSIIRQDDRGKAVADQGDVKEGEEKPKRPMITSFLSRLGRPTFVDKLSSEMPQFAGFIGGGIAVCTGESGSTKRVNGNIFDFTYLFAEISDFCWSKYEQHHSKLVYFIRTPLGSFVFGLSRRKEVIIAESPRYRASTTTSRTTVTDGMPGVMNDVYFSGGAALETCLADLVGDLKLFFPGVRF